MNFTEVLNTMKNLLIFLIILFIQVSCYTHRDENTQKVFRYNESQGISTLDPAFARIQVIIWPVAQIFNGLLQLNDTLGIEPCIAKRWEVSADGMEYTFYLRDDVYFHDNIVFKNSIGRKVNADDFKFSFNRIIDEKTASPGSWIFSNVDFSAEKGFQAVHDTVFRIYLKQPFPAFPGVMTMQYCSVVSREAVEYYGNDFGRQPVGTGPFMYKYWKEMEKLILVKNPHYFEKDEQGNQLPYLDAVAISFVRDKQSEFLEFMKQEIDFLNHVHKSYKNELLTPAGQLNPKYEDKLIMYKDNYLNTEYLAIYVGDKIDQSQNPLKYKEIKQAINYGFDRVKMLRYLRNNIGEPALAGFIPRGLPGYVEGWGYHFDPDTARLLVEKVKAEIGEIPPITLTTTGDYSDLCEFIQHELSAIGLTIQIEISVGATFRSMVANSKAPFFRASWLADYPDAENYLALFYSKNFSPAGPNYTHFSNEEFDKLYEQSLKERNLEKRTGLYHQMDKIIMNEAVIVPLFYDQVVRFTHKEVEGLSTNPVNLLVLKKVKKKLNN